MLTVEEAQQALLAEVSLIESEEVALTETHGRILREDVVAATDVPLADNSAMDGYAIRAEDSGPRRVIGEVRAGSVASMRVEAGTAMRIMTGAPVPEGADAVAQIEITDRGEDVVEIHESVKRGANIRRRGEDMRAGDLVLSSGTFIGPGELGVLATARRARAVVARRPVVAVLSTGDELVDAGEHVAAGRVVNSNVHTLSALVRDCGAIARPQSIVRDSREATIAAIEQALACDYVISSGGVSVGAYDFVKDALEALGGETKFWRVAMKPGKPVFLSRVRERLFFGLPGNPVSCMVTFTLFVAPALRKAMGASGVLPPVVNLTTTAPLRGSERRTYVRVRVFARGGELLAEPMRAQSSGATTSMSGANGLAVVQPGVREIEAGTVVPVILMGPI